MEKRAAKWEKVGDRYVLKEEHCYPGTAVVVQAIDSKQWIFILINQVEQPQTEQELSRKKGRTRSKVGWASAATAKTKALTYCRSQRWLEAAGISFNPQNEKGAKS